MLDYVTECPHGFHKAFGFGENIDISVCFLLKALLESFSSFTCYVFLESGEAISSNVCAKSFGVYCTS